MRRSANERINTAYLPLASRFTTRIQEFDDGTLLFTQIVMKD